jgi:dihydroorotate dehydrogenase
MYNLARQLLFKLSPEASHDLSIDLIGAGGRLGLNGLFNKAPMQLPVTVMGLRFPNPVGLAAGLDKNGAAIDGFAQLGFGFVEIGTVTPRPQPGNPKPRIFRLPHAEAIINRMGFNNLGVDNLVSRVQAAQYNGVLGINIGKNADTPVERAVDDYLICLDKVYDHASYITVNVSSPNTPGLRSLQFGDSLKQLLQALRSRQEALTHIHGKRAGCQRAAGVGNGCRDCNQHHPQPSGRRRVAPRRRNWRALGRSGARAEHAYRQSAGW